MNNYFITDRNIKDLTIVVSVGGAATSKDVVSSYRPFDAFNQIDSKGQKYVIGLHTLMLPTVSNKKLDGILYRQTAKKIDRTPEYPVWADPRDFAIKQHRNKNPQAFCNKSTQFILRNIGAEISYSTAKEVLGNPTRKGKFLVWPTASFEQEVVMTAIDQCHDRCNGAIYNGVITIGHQQIKIADYLKKM